MSLVANRAISKAIIMFVMVLAIYLSSHISVQSAATTSLMITPSLQNRTSAANQPFEITLARADSGFTEVILSDTNGNITLNGLNAGDYTLRIKHPQYLAVTLPVRLGEGTNKLDVGPLKGGDVNDDNFVSSEDATVISSVFNRVSDTEGYDPRADLNADQRVTLVDFSLLSSNYGQTGAAVLNVPSPLTVIFPSQIINLANWKITLPLGESEHPTEITQPKLSTFSISPWFRASTDGTGIFFRAPVDGVTTSGSNYPRSELREMTNNGTKLASWSSTSGTHTMYIDEAIKAVPVTKKHIVVGQIHDSSDDVIVIRLEYPTLFVDVGGTKKYTLDSNYTLGKRFNVKFVVSGGKTSVYYNGSSKPVYVLSKSYSKSYFKAGAYTQSNCSTEGQASLCNDNNFGEVTIYKLTVNHQ